MAISPRRTLPCGRRFRLRAGRQPSFLDRVRIALSRVVAEVVSSRKGGAPDAAVRHAEVYVMRVRPSGWPMEERVLDVIRRGIVRIGEPRQPIHPVDQRSQRADCHLHIDDGFRGEAWNARGAHVVNSKHPIATGAPETRGLLSETCGPRRIVGNQFDHVDRFRDPQVIVDREPRGVAVRHRVMGMPPRAVDATLHCAPRNGRLQRIKRGAKRPMDHAIRR